MFLHFQVHFERSNLLVVSSRKEIKKDVIPSRFCHCPSDVFQDSHSNCDLYAEHSYSKSQPKKRRKEETHVRNVKTRLDSHICREVDTSEHFCISVKNLACTIIDTMESAVKLSKKQVRIMNHKTNCSFTALPLSINENKKRNSIEKNLCIMSNFENICLSSDVLSIKRTVRKFTTENEILKNVIKVMEFCRISLNFIKFNSYFFIIPLTYF